MRPMKMEHTLVGERIKIILDDDGTGKPPELPPGTVVRSLVGTDRGTYFVVRLDHPVRSLQASTKQDWVLLNLAITNRYKGDSLDSLTGQPSGKLVTVGIANVLAPIPDDESVLDFAKVEYFALGRVSRL